MIRSSPSPLFLLHQFVDLLSLPFCLIYFIELLAQNRRKKSPSFQARASHANFSKVLIQILAE